MSVKLSSKLSMSLSVYLSKFDWFEWIKCNYIFKDTSDDISLVLQVFPILTFKITDINSYLICLCLFINKLCIVYMY